jgi:NitT/TauT family transport system substrate-binding protein
MRNFTFVFLRNLFLAAFVVGTFGVASTSQAAPEKKKLTLGYASMSGGFGGFWVAKEKGYFEEQGLEVELLYTRTTVGLQALSSGHIDAMGTGCAEFFEANRKGYENRVVASLFENNLYLLASAKNITEPKMLVGKSIAVNRIGDTGHMSIRFALRRAGVDPDKITYVQVGSTPERFSALSKGAVAGAVQVGALRPLVTKNGLNVLIDLQKEKFPSCLGGIGLKAETIKTSPKTVEALLKALVKGNAYLAAGPAEDTKKIFSRYMKLPIDDKKLLLGWSFFVKDAHSRKPKMTTEAAQGVMDMMAEADPTWSKEKAERYLDQSFMNELDKSGYLDAVYKEIGAKPKM